MSIVFNWQHKPRATNSVAICTINYHVSNSSKNVCSQGSTMKLTSFLDIEALLDGPLIAESVSSALKLGLFWELELQSQTPIYLAEFYGIPLPRCQKWLNLLVQLGLLQVENGEYSPSIATKQHILEHAGHKSWTLITREARDSYPVTQELYRYLMYPGSLRQAHQITSIDYFTKILEEEGYAEQFTTMLYDRHREFAQELAKKLDLEGIQTLLDIGGGSGVISLALLQHNPKLTSTVIDVLPVCEVGKQIALKTKVADRITYQALNFIEDPLPKEMDVVLMCDAGSFKQEFLEKLRTSLRRGGKLIIITNLDPSSAWLTHEDQQVSLKRSLNEFYYTLASLEPHFRTIEELKIVLHAAGYEEVRVDIWESGPVILHATTFD
jgi:ubiquinone/menaquinone biosynthesis C-methylase UbiE